MLLPRKNHQTCVLGRGGSDTSGGLFAAVLGAERFEIWTDVHGMFTSDPRNIKAARHIKELSYREAQELAAMGAKVLNPRCLAPPAWAKIPVEIHNTMDPKNRQKCTRIVSPEMLEDFETTVMAIARRLGQVHGNNIERGYARCFRVSEQGICSLRKSWNLCGPYCHVSVRCIDDN